MESTQPGGSFYDVTSQQLTPSGSWAAVKLKEIMDPICPEPHFPLNPIP